VADILTQLELDLNRVKHLYQQQPILLIPAS
jgi:hypothetical protein